MNNLLEAIKWMKKGNFAKSPDGRKICILKDEFHEEHPSGRITITQLTLFSITGEWKLIYEKEKSFRPLNKEEVFDLVGEKVKHLDGDICIITSVSTHKIIVANINYNYENFHKFHTHLDGSKIGIEE